MLWVRSLKYVGQTKRTAQLGRTHELAGRFLYLMEALGQRSTLKTLCLKMVAHSRWSPPPGEDTPLKTDQLGAAGWDYRCGTWLPAAQGTLYSYKGQGFLPGRTGLNPLRRNTLGDQGLREIGLTALPPPAGT